jgi:hypothetical protein
MYSRIAANATPTRVNTPAVADWLCRKRDDAPIAFVGVATSSVMVTSTPSLSVVVVTV